MIKDIGKRKEKKNQPRRMKETDTVGVIRVEGWMWDQVTQFDGVEPPLAPWS